MRTAVVQINSGPDRDLNIESAGRQVLPLGDDVWAVPISALWSP